MEQTGCPIYQFVSGSPRLRGDLYIYIYMALIDSYMALVCRYHGVTC